MADICRFGARHQFVTFKGYIYIYIYRATMRQNADTDKMVAEVLGHHDVVASVLCVEIATEAVIEYLIRRKQVCKDWCAHISLLLQNTQWLAPFVRSAQRFVCSIVYRQSEMRALGNGSGSAIALAKSGIIAKYVAGMNLHMFDENSQLRALSVLQLILKSKTLRTQHFMSIVTVLKKNMDKHVSKFPPKNGVTPKLPSEVAQCL